MTRPEEPDATSPSPVQQIQGTNSQGLGGGVSQGLGGGVLDVRGELRSDSFALARGADEGPRRLLWEEYGLPAPALEWPLLVGALVGYGCIGLATALTYRVYALWRAQRLEATGAVR